MSKSPDYKELFNLLYQSIKSASQTLYESSSRCEEICLEASMPRGPKPSKTSLERLRPYSVQTMRIMCETYGLTPAEVFPDSGQPVSLSDGEQQLLRRWGLLQEPQRKALLALLDSMTSPSGWL